MLALRITLLRILRTKLNHLLTYSCRLFVTLEKVKPHKKSNFQHLLAKHTGGGAKTHPRCSELHFPGPLFSQSYELLFPQLPSFTTICIARGCGVKPHHSREFFKHE